MAVATRGDHTYQASDLAGRGRRAFLDDAKAGVARLRDTDGASLVMLPEPDLGLLTELRTHFLAYLCLENAVRRERATRRSTDFGELAWASVLADDDLETFRDELREELTRAISGRSLAGLTELLRAWRLTAEFMADEEAVARAADGSLDAYEDLPRPEDVRLEE